MNLKRSLVFLNGLLFLAIIYQAIPAAKAQNISKFYTSSIQDKGTLYYIFPLKLNNNKKHLSFFYDITSLSSKDSISVNFTFYNNKKLVIDSFCLKNFNQELNLIPIKLFVETDKKYWIYRYSVQIHNANFNALFKSIQPPNIYLICNGEEKTELKIRKKSWKKQSKIISKILEIKDMNR